MKPDSTIRFITRTLIFGSIIIALNCYWIIAAENRVVWELTDFSIFPTVMFTLFLIAGVNLLLRRYLKNLALDNAELATIYVMVSVATALAGHDMVRQLVPLMANPEWYATPENEWKDLFSHHLPSWLTVNNREVLRGYFEGGTTFWTRQNIAAWIVPIAAWSSFLVVVLLVMLCINIIVRKQWIENEKLSYPLTVLPTEVIGNTAKLFSNKLIWIGLGVAFGLELLAGLNYLYPSIPTFKIKYIAEFHDKPWNVLGRFPIYVYPFAIGLGYLMPLDLSFSLWFFFLGWKAQRIFFGAMGWTTALTLQNQQRSGAWIGIGLIALWTSRKHIASVITGVFKEKGHRDNDKVYNFAVFGLVLGVAAILIFWDNAGLSPWIAAGYFGIYFLICIAMTRMRAELGPPTHELHWTHPDRIMVRFLGTRAIGAGNLTNTTLLSWLAYGYRCHPMPHQLEGFKIGSNFKIRPGRLVIAMVVASLVGAVMSIGLHVVLYYKFRGFFKWGREEFDYLRGVLMFPQDPNFEAIQHMGLGFVITATVAMMKRRFMWWSLYPVGYAVGDGWAIGWMWFSIFLGWLSKRLLFAGGGVRHYRMALPLFIGFIFGQFIAGSLWSLVGVILNKQVYTLFP